MIARMLVTTLLAVGAVDAADRRWENPAYQTESEAIAAARRARPPAAADDQALHLFLASTIGFTTDEIARERVGRFLLTHPATFLADSTQRATVERFATEVPRQRTVVEGRMARFGFPELDGLVYLRLVESVDAFSHLGGPSSNRMSQIGGVTYFCRYIVLPLSYVGERRLAQLRNAHLRNPSLDIEATLRRWQRESFANLVNTFRHELVHVHTNSSVGLPDYADRRRFPTWFREGTATYLSGDPTAGLSPRYQEYQAAFFYLAERHGIPRLRTFFRAVLTHRDVAAALLEVYAIEDSEQLLVAGARWRRLQDAGRTIFWVAVLSVLVAAFRGMPLPVIGSLLVLVGIGLAAATAAGLAEQLWGLRGAGVVRAAATGQYALAGVLGAAGGRRVWRSLRRRS